MSVNLFHKFNYDVCDIFILHKMYFFVCVHFKDFLNALIQRIFPNSCNGMQKYMQVQNIKKGHTTGSVSYDIQCSTLD